MFCLVYIAIFLVYENMYNMRVHMLFYKRITEIKIIFGYYTFCVDCTYILLHIYPAAPFPIFVFISFHFSSQINTCFLLLKYKLICVDVLQVIFFLGFTSHPRQQLTSKLCDTDDSNLDLIY